MSWFPVGIPVISLAVSYEGRELQSVHQFRAVADQSAYFEKTALSEPTPEELQLFKDNGDRIRELFAELEQLSKAA